MADDKKVDKSLEGEPLDDVDTNIAVPSSEVCSVSGSVKTSKTQRMSSSSDRQVKFERAQKALENAALVSKRIKEHRKATAELLGRPFEEDDIGDSAEMASTISERTGYSVATDTSTNISVQDALNIPGISESLANTLKQKELLMERIKQYKEISKRPIKTSAIKKDPITDSKLDLRKTRDNSDVTQLLNTIKDKENALSVIQVKMKAMETTILDLQEKLNEKDQIIEAKNMATTLMSDSLSKKEKDSLLLLEDTRQQMTKMQENFINMETEWKEERQRLIKEIELKEEKICNLEEANTILENSRFAITVAHSKLLEELDLKNKEISELKENIDKLSAEKTSESIPKEKEDFVEEKGSLEISQMVELSKKVELLEQINCQIRQTNIELENKLSAVNTDLSKAASISSPSKKASPVPGRKGVRNTASKMKSPWSNLSSESLQQETDKKGNKNEITKLEMLIQSLNKDILEKEYMISQKDALISELQSIQTIQETTIQNLKSAQIIPSAEVVDMGVVTEPTETVAENSDVDETNKAHEPTLPTREQILDMKELEEILKTAQQKIISLNEEVDLANKNMIKVKSSHKLKIKQMQKTIDNFSKVSDSNAEIVKLNEEMHQLTQKVAELEEEKGNLQLHLVDYDSGRLTESDVYKKMIEMENIAETRLKAISMLEAQKFDLVQELHVLQQKNMEMEDKLADMSQLQSEQVCSEMKSVQLEEQIDELIASRKELELIIENLKLDKEHLNSTIKITEDEKDELAHKLESYIQENIELTDKLEKLSTEKVSSAESIEIVESLTTQERLELEAYNTGMMESKSDPNVDRYKEGDVGGNEKSIESLVEQAAELNKKIDLFNQERQEVMDKMSKINAENKILHENIAQHQSQCSNLQSNIDLLTNEKHELISLNAELNQKIEDLKRERLEIVKETIEVPKPSAIEETLEAVADAQQDDKGTGEKGVNRNKSVKQLTKEILKLKNIVKDREAEIADCQMKILSLEEQHQKQNELLQTNASYEAKLKSLVEENKLLVEDNQALKDKLGLTVVDKQIERQLEELKQANELLQDKLQKTRQEYSSTISARDMRLHELENLLRDYEKQILNYGNTLQQKDKEMVEYINQITKLNDVSQKLKSTIELLEEEKAKDQNAELIKSLNKQISAYQKKLTEYEEKLKALEEEKSQLMTIKSSLESKNISIETELKKSQDLLVEKQTLMKELQAQQQKHSEEVANVLSQAKDRDEEIHEIKLQLRKESIENEKLRNLLAEKDKSSEEYSHLMQDTTDKINKLSIEKEQLSQQCLTLEGKNKELMEKLKKFAVNIKKKSSMYTELETQFNQVQQQLNARNGHLEQLSIQVETLPALQDKLKHAEEEINRLQSQKVSMEQQKAEMKGDIEYFSDKLTQASEEITGLNNTLNVTRKELYEAQEENSKLKYQIDIVNKKNVEHEIEQKNNMNLITKISSLEADNNQKQAQIAELLHNLENQEQILTQLQFGHDAKVQERDLYIETLETEMNKYKNRICRLEESISLMEDRRHSLERKADQLDSQLQEKQKAYSDYSNQEDELVGRLAVLMDHDRVVEKQLHEIERENRHLQDKIHHFTEENNHLRKSLSEVQDNYNTIIDKANRTDAAENTILKLQTQVCDLDTQLKRVTQEHQILIVKKKQDIDDLESEFNTQIENAIKEKKILSEKYEKNIEHITQLELKLQEYRKENERLEINMEELNRINQDILDKSALQQQHASPDYTEQYISEINRLNSLVNNKNHEIHELNNKLQTVQVNGVATVSNLESKNNELTSKLQQSTSDVDQLINEIQILKQDNEQLQAVLLQKEEQFNELKDRKKVTFEMNIPKTEGLLISSTIEAVNTEESAKLNISDLESQILSDVSSNYSDTKPSDSKTTESLPKNTFVVDTNVPDSKIVSEEIIVPKKAYLCYKEDQEDNQKDPFNSDEGWGFGEPEVVLSEVIPVFSHHNEQISQLQKENETLKKEIEVNNTKLLKVMKKLKELKNNNEMLSNELKISKQLSQSSFLDSAIEDELRRNIEELEKKVEELNSDLKKEKRDKETIKKQNEVFNSANERLTDMKEKLDNEIELWKFKFKEINDKMSTLQWDAENKDSPQHKVSASQIDISGNSNKNEIIKLEKENDELQSMVDQLTTKNRELLSLEAKLRSEIDCITQQMIQQQSCQNCESLNGLITQLKEMNSVLTNNNETINKKLKEVEGRYSEAIQMFENLKQEKDEFTKLYENSKHELVQKSNEFENELKTLKHSKIESNINLESLKVELESSHQQLRVYEEQLIASQNEDSLILSEKCNALEEYCSQMKCQLDEFSNKIIKLETLNQEMVKKLRDYENQSKDELKCSSEGDSVKTLQLETKNRELELKIKENEQQMTDLTTKLQNLNTENDQLLSSVAELRSSMSSAVDQRGFEIAELWKQHLAQREADFLKTEQELRAEISTSEAKYELLLDNVQSSSQDETNQLIMMEQVTSLQNKLQDKEGHLHSLQEKYCEVMNQLELLRSEIEDEKVMYENKFLAQQEEYEKLIQDKEDNNRQNTENYEQKYKNAQNDLATFKANNEELRQQVDDFNRKLEEVTSTIVELNNQIRLKDSEIYQKTHEYTISLAQRNEEFENVRKQLLEFEKKIEELSFEKESELAVLRLKMHENTEYYERNLNDVNIEKSNLAEALNAKIVECTNLNKQITDLNKLLEEHAARTREMQTALENQELEIVTLKDELTTLENMMRKASSRIEKHVTFASDTKPSDEGESREGLVNKELLDAVPRAELDLALYMLHQRDVRCEELTMELTRLLEERDTLQLRLSDSLRSNEEMKSKIKSIELDTSTDSRETVSELPSFSTEREHAQFVDIHRGQTSRSSSISDIDGDRPKLQAKLSELRSVKHSRDVRFRQESEQRQLDLRLLQRDVANLPPEAVDQLAQAHHTLSRDSQSTSTVLLNWLRGKSTPKVVHM